MLLKDIIKDLDVLRVEGPMDVDITSIYYDSRRVTPGSLFFCIEGYNFDGHDFAAGAVEAGARAVILNRDPGLPDHISKIFVKNTRQAMGMAARTFYNYPVEGMSLIGVTGTNGKTTVTYLLKAILEQAGAKVGLIGTISNIIGQTKLPAERTTPESPDLQRLFRDMADMGVETVVMEVSSHSLELDRVVGCVFDAGVFTNLSQDHLDFHGSFENYSAVKAKLLNQSRTAVINVDDQTGREYLSGLSNGVVKAITYGIQRPADVYARDLEITTRGVSFNIHYGEETVSVNMNIPGIFSVYNALAAATACFELRMSALQIKQGLESVRGVPGRFELLDTDTDYSVILDYAHTPDGLENILKTARSMTRGRVITLFGCGGDRDVTKRPVMGETAGRNSDYCIVTSDNPRSEEPMDIIEHILPGLDKTQCPYRVIEDRREAIAHALSYAHDKDVVILAGKGHETYQIIKNKTCHFDEKEIVAEILGRERV